MSHARSTEARPSQSAPLPPGAAMNFIVMGPESSGKRTLAKLLEFNASFDFACLPPARQRFLRLCAQVTAAEAVLQALRGHSHVPKDKVRALEQLLERSCGPDGMVADEQLEAAFVAAAAALASEPAVLKACASTKSVARLDSATAHFLDEPQRFFSSGYVPTRQDVLSAREPLAALLEPQVSTVPVHAKGGAPEGEEVFNVVTLPAMWWSAAAREGSDKAQRLDAMCSGPEPFCAVLVVPLDDFCADENGRGTTLEEAHRSKRHDKKRKKRHDKEKERPAEDEDEQDIGRQLAHTTGAPSSLRYDQDFAPPPLRQAALAQHQQDVSSSSGSSEHTPVVPTSSPAAAATRTEASAAAAGAPTGSGPAATASTGGGGGQSLPPSFLAMTAPAAMNVASLYARRKRAQQMARGRNNFVLSVDTTPLNERAVAVRVEDECETPTTCCTVEPLSAVGPGMPPMFLQEAEAQMSKLSLEPTPAAPTASTASASVPTLAPAPIHDHSHSQHGEHKKEREKTRPKEKERKRRKPFVNKLTTGLNVVKKLAHRRVVQNAESVFVVLTRADRFAASCPAIESLCCAFPDYAEEDTAGSSTAARSSSAAAYVAALFDAALHSMQAERRHVLRCTLVDYEQTRATLVDAIYGVAEQAARVKQAARRLECATQELVAAKRAAGCVRAPASRSGVCRCQSGHASEQGRRTSNEDALAFNDDLQDAAFGDKLAYYAVYDGHNGSDAALVCSRIVHTQLLYHRDFPAHPERFFAEGYARADALVTAACEKSGATAVTAIVFGSTLFVANIGDSECILVSRSDAAHAHAHTHTVLTVKHLLESDEERQRVQELGGMVVFGRLFGSLQVSRAFGDAEFKQPGKEYVSVAPHVAVRELGRSDEVLVLACDGLWEQVSYGEVAERAVELRASGCTPQQASQALAQLALERGTKDNVTVLVVFLDWPI